ncbi:phosphatidate cytidylyltransferase, putative [Hepatocystis sp. ex Piliocolobus tephrosceles]|nr:phosphatidate cytidylyltransferase, putative [Hepatocystis sp. ex Piliocolobus tephrosceles]
MEMIHIILICLIIIREIKKNTYFFNFYTHVWILFTLICNTLITICLYYKKKKNGKLKDNYYFCNYTLIIGEFYKKEKIPTILYKTNNNTFMKLHLTNLIDFFQLFFSIYIHNFFVFFFLPFMSTLLYQKYNVLSYELAKLSIVFLNEFIVFSVFLRYVKVNIVPYIICHIVVFILTLIILKNSENIITSFLCFLANFTFYHSLFISSFNLINRVFTFGEAVLVSVIGTFVLDLSVYSLIYEQLKKRVIPGVLFIFFSRVIISLFIYGVGCIYYLRSEFKQKKNILLISVLFILYNVYNLISKQKHALHKTDITAWNILIDIIIKRDNYILIITWTIISFIYLIYINDLAKKQTHLFNLRKHYHFLLFVNIILSFLIGNVLLLIVVLSFFFLFLIYCEYLRKICNNVFPTVNILDKFAIRFIDERDKRGLVITHLYLLAGVYIPIVLDAIANNKNFIHKHNQSIYLFQEANIPLYLSGLNSICIGDSFAAIGGFLYPTPKIAYTNNKSYSGCAFFFFTTFASLIVSSYFLNEINLTSTYIFFMVSLFGALFEAYLYDIDNLILPIFTFVVYLCFEA